MPDRVTAGDSFGHEKTGASPALVRRGKHIGHGQRRMGGAAAAAKEATRPDVITPARKVVTPTRSASAGGDRASLALRVGVRIVLAGVIATALAPPSAQHRKLISPCRFVVQMPEPTSLALFGLGAAGLAGLARGRSGGHTALTGVRRKSIEARSLTRHETRQPGDRERNCVMHTRQSRADAKPTMNSAVEVWCSPLNCWNSGSALSAWWNAPQRARPADPAPLAAGGEHPVVGRRAQRTATPHADLGQGQLAAQRDLVAAAGRRGRRSSRPRPRVR